MYILLNIKKNKKRKKIKIQHSELLTKSMSRSSLPISSGRETSLLLAACSTSSPGNSDRKGGNVVSWLRLEHTTYNSCITGTYTVYSTF